MYQAFILTTLLLVSLSGHAQKQLLVLKKEKVILRLNPGDEFTYRLKGEKQVITSYVNNVFDTAVMAHQTVIAFHKIDRVFFKQSNYLNVIGGLMVTAGVGYFVIDQVNETLVNRNQFNIDDRVANTSITLTAIGLPLMLIHKKSQRIKGKYRMIMAEKGSPFYQAPLLHAFP